MHVENNALTEELEQLGAWKQLGIVEMVNVGIQTPCTPQHGENADRHSH